MLARCCKFHPADDVVFVFVFVLSVCPSRNRKSTCKKTAHLHVFVFVDARLPEVMEQSILKEAQGGFRKNRRTTDKIIVVNGSGQLRRSRGKKTWMAF